VCLLHADVFILLDMPSCHDLLCGTLETHTIPFHRRQDDWRTWAGIPSPPLFVSTCLDSAVLPGAVPPLGSQIGEPSAIVWACAHQFPPLLNLAGQAQSQGWGTRRFNIETVLSTVCTPTYQPFGARLGHRS